MGGDLSGGVIDGEIAGAPGDGVDEPLIDADRRPQDHQDGHQQRPAVKQRFFQHIGAGFGRRRIQRLFGECVHCSPAGTGSSRPRLLARLGSRLYRYQDFLNLYSAVWKCNRRARLRIYLKRLSVARPSEKAMGKDAGGKSPQSYPWVRRGLFPPRTPPMAFAAGRSRRCLLR